MTGRAGTAFSAAADEGAPEGPDAAGAEGWGGAGVGSAGVSARVRATDAAGAEG
jgi:hypothetical protein